MCASAALAGGFAAAAAAEAVAYEDLRPILQERCVMCHSGAGAAAGLDLSSMAGLLAGSARGTVVTPFDPDASELMRRLRGESLPRMPLTGPPYLSDDDIARFARWIEDGARADGESEPDGEAAGADVMPGGDAAAADEAPGGGASGAAAEPPPVAAPPPPDASGPVTYADVQPLLLARCATCHTAAGLLGPPPEGYRLDSYDEAIRADDRARIVPANPAASELVRRVIGHAEPRMPLGGPYLDDAEIDLLVRWIDDGARDASGTHAARPTGADVRLHGTWRGPGLLDDLHVVVDGDTRFDDDVRPGDRVQLRGVLEADGRIRAERIRLE